MHGDVQEDRATRSLDGKNQRFCVSGSGEALVVHVNLWRKDLEAKALVVEQGYGISDDHVGEFADRLANGLLAIAHFSAREFGGDSRGNFRREIEDDAALDIAFDSDQRGDSLPTVGFFLHREVSNRRWTLQGLRKDSVRGVDERLNKLHPHERCSPASTAGAPTALGSSLNT